MTLSSPPCRTSPLGARHRPAPPAPTSFEALSRSISSGDMPSNGSTSSDTAKFLCRWSRSAPASIAARALSSRSSRSIRFRSLFRVSFIHAYLPAKPNTTTTPAMKRAFAHRGMTLSSSTFTSTWENRGLLHAWMRFAAMRSACGGNRGCRKGGGIQLRFRRGEMRQRAPVHLEVVIGVAATEGVSRWNHRHSTYLRPTRGSTVVFGRLAKFVQRARARGHPRHGTVRDPADVPGHRHIADAREARGGLDRRADRPSKHGEE